MIVDHCLVVFDITYRGWAQGREEERESGVVLVAAQTVESGMNGSCEKHWQVGPNDLEKKMIDWTAKELQMYAI